MFRGVNSASSKLADLSDTFEHVNHDDARTGPGRKAHTVQLVRRAKDRHFGIALEDTQDGAIRVREIIPGSAAAISEQVIVGDFLIAIDGKPTKGMSMNLVVDRMQQRKNQMITLTLERITTQTDTNGMQEPEPRITPQEMEQFFANFHEACKCGNAEEVIKVVNSNFHHARHLINEAPFAPLHLACELGHVDLVMMLATLIVDINKKSDLFGGTALYVATKHRHSQIVELLLDSGAQQELDHFSPESALRAAIVNDDAPLARTLAAASSLTPPELMLIAAKLDKHHLIPEFYIAGIDINFNPNSQDMSLLMCLLLDWKNKQVHEADQSIVETAIKFVLAKGGMIDLTVVEVCVDVIIDIAKTKPGILSKEYFTVAARPLLLYHVCKRGEAGLLTDFWHDSVNPNNPIIISSQKTPDSTLLLVAAFSGMCAVSEKDTRPQYRKIVRFLLNKGATITEAVDIACPSGVKNFLQRRKDNNLPTTRQVNLNWSDNNLAYINFDWLKNLNKVRFVELDLSSNPFEDLTAELPWNLPQLETFILTNCPNVKRLSDPLSNGGVCVKLSKVVISKNQKLEYVSPMLFIQPALKFMDLSGNKLCFEKTATPNKWECGELEHLNLSNNAITWLPDGIKSARNLKELLLADNQLEDLPAAWRCPLVKLDVSHNKLVGWPESIDQHWKDCLQTINASHNELTEILPSVSSLKRLINLDLSHNKIKDLPAANIWGCKRLQTLNLSNNLLGQTHLPPKQPTGLLHTITAGGSRTRKYSGAPSINFPTVFAERINSVNLSYNMLSQLPSAVCELVTLSELNISNNPMKELPYELGKLKALELLTINGLNLENLPIYLNPTKLKKEPRTCDVLEYLRSKYRKEVPYSCMKLIVLGAENCGKTTLISQLTQLTMRPKKKDFALAVSAWKMDVPNSIKRDKPALRYPILINVWELAGPEMYYPVHQCFMTDDALYVLVVRLDSKRFREEIPEWLLNIKARAPHSSVLIVGTHLESWQVRGDKTEIDELNKLVTYITKEIPQKVARCPRIINFIAVSQEASQNITAVRDAIMHFAVEKLSNTMVPQSYKDLHDEIQRIKDDPLQSNSQVPWLTKDHLLQRIKDNCNDIDVSDEEEIKKVVTLLNNSGTLLHYAEDVRALQTSYYYLNPVWLSEKMLKLINLKTAKRKLTTREVQHLLQDNYCHPDTTVKQILEILQRFELLLMLTNDLMLLPSKLPAQAPEIEFEYHGQSVCRWYSMPCLPPGFWSRLLVRLLTILRYISEPNAMHSAMDNAAVAALGYRYSIHDDQAVWAKTVQKSTWQVLYWAEGCVMLYDGGYLRVESLKQSPLVQRFESSAEEPAMESDFTTDQLGVVITVQNSTGRIRSIDHAYFCLAIDEVDQLTTYWFPNYEIGEHRIKRYAVCPLCLDELLQAHSVQEDNRRSVGFYPLETLARYVTKFSRVRCPANANHAEDDQLLESVVPDLMYADLPQITKLNKHLLGANLTPLERGGQSQICKGTFGKRDIALKVYVAITCTDNRVINTTHHSPAETKSPETPMSPAFSTAGSAMSNKIVLDGSRLRTDSEATIGSEDFYDPDVDLKILIQMQNMRREIMLLKSLRHACIVSLVGILVEPDMPTSFALEFAQLGNLGKFMCDARMAILNKTEQQGIIGCLVDRLLLFKIALQIVGALKYLHENKIIYRDLKCDNVLVWSKDVNVFPNVKLSDYGISSILGPEGAKGEEGTPGFQAPEILKKLVYDAKADVFSLAMVFYELLSGLRPFHEMSFPDDIQRCIKRGKRPDLKDVHVYPNFVNLQELMRKCWHDDPHSRPSSEEILQSMDHIDFYTLQAELELKEDDTINPQVPGYEVVALPESRRTSQASVRSQMFSPNEHQTVEWRVKRLHRMPQSERHIWFYSFNKSGARLLNVIDLHRGAFDEEHLLLALGHFTDISITDTLAFVLNTQAPPSIDVFEFGPNHLPELLNDKPGALSGAAVDVCSITCWNTETEVHVVAGTVNGKLLLYRAASDLSDWNLLPYQRSVVLSNEGCVKPLIMLPKVGECCAAIAGSVYFVNIIQSDSPQILRLFGDYEIGCLNATSCDVIWCTCTMSYLAYGCSMKTPHCVLYTLDLIAPHVERNVLFKTEAEIVDNFVCQRVAERKSSNQARPTFTMASSSMDEDDVFDDPQLSLGISRVEVVRNCAWFALSDARIILVCVEIIGNHKFGDVVAMLQLPGSSHNCKLSVDDMLVSGSNVAILATATMNYTSNELYRQNLSQPARISSSGSFYSTRSSASWIGTPINQPLIKQKVFVYAAVDIQAIDAVKRARNEVDNC